jgi:predicted  nucleic acid-binding Zn-ribbon protein
MAGAISELAEKSGSSSQEQDSLSEKIPPEFLKAYLSL